MNNPDNSALYRPHLETLQQRYDEALAEARLDAVVIAALARLRPVVLAAATTVLGVVPLLQDVFWVGMAITIMAGLAFGTVLTMLVVPVLYCMFFKVPSPEKGN